MKIKIALMATLAMFATVVEARHHHHGGHHCRPHGGYYHHCRPRPAHYVRSYYSGPYYDVNPHYVHGNFRVYTPPVVANRYYTTRQTTYTPNGYVVVSEVVEQRAPATSYYQPVQHWQPGVTIVQPTTTVVEPAPVVTTGTTYVVPQNNNIIGAGVNVLGIKAGVGIGL